MENVKGNNTRSVPQFGGWDQQTGGETNYSMVFQKARDNRKKQTSEVAARNSVGNEREILKKPHDIPVANRKKYTSEVAAGNTVGNDREVFKKPQDIPVANRKKQISEVAASNNEGNEPELLNKPQDHDIPVANNTRTVPQFRAWDQKTEGENNYSMVFQKVRANRKKHFIDVTPTSNSVGNERELTKLQDQDVPDANRKKQTDEVIASNNVGNGRELLNKPQDIPVANIKKQTNEVIASNNEGNERELNKPQDNNIPVANNVRSVPQFGGWDQKTEGETNYSMVFQKARANRKKHIIDVTKTSNSVGNERELIKPQDPHVHIVNNMSSVPQFGAWDYKTGGETNYSMVFQQARANRQKQKDEVTTNSSLGNEREFLNKPHNQGVPVVKKKRLMSYLSCCVRPY